MKVKSTVFFWILFLAAPLIRAADINLKFSAGMDWINPASLNRVQQDWFTFIKLDAEAHKNYQFLGGKAQDLRSLFELEGEIYFSLTKNWAVSVGSGLIFGEIPQNQTEISVEKLVGTFVYVHPAQISAIPVMISGYGSIKLWEPIRVYAKVGAGFLWTKFVERYRRLLIPNKKYSLLKMSEATAGNPIYQAGLGFLYEVESGIRFFLEGGYRIARARNFSGSRSDGEEGKLYSFEEYSSDLDLWVLQLEILPEPPAGDIYRSIQEAVLDLSGFTLKLGLIIRF